MLTLNGGQSEWRRLVGLRFEVPVREWQRGLSGLLQLVLASPVRNTGWGGRSPTPAHAPRCDCSWSLETHLSPVADSRHIRYIPISVPFSPDHGLSGPREAQTNGH